MTLQPLSLIAGLLLLASCTSEDSNSKQPPSVKIDKHGAIEMKIEQSYPDSSNTVEITTFKNFYDNAGNLIKTIVSRDTVAGLGMISDTLETGRLKKDDDGNDSPVDTIIKHHKNYQFYITVK
jgi:hypothetical protein